MLSAELNAERDALIAEICAAFADVSRQGGVSWNETSVIDRFGTDEERRVARESDLDRAWTELAEDDEWDPVASFGGFPFLDAIGFRYYLPAAMIKNIEGGWRHAINSILTVNKATKPGGFRLREHYLEKWSLLDDRQRRCVARFIRFKIAEAEAKGHSDVADSWRPAYERYWKSGE